MADSNTPFHQSIPKFEGFYDHWAELMENLLRSKEFWSLIEHGVSVAPANATQEQIRAAEESKLKDLKVKNYLYQSIDRAILETILDRSTSRSIWESMRQKYQGSTRVKRAQLQSLRREFELLLMQEDESVYDYFRRTLAIATKMTTQGETLSQATIVEKITRSMTQRFEYVICSIEESRDVTTMSIDELQSSLLVHKGRMKRHRAKDEEQALKASNLGRSNSNSSNSTTTRGRGRGSRGRGRGRSNPISKEFVECYKCHKLGHYQSECPSWEECANYAEFNEHEELLMMAQEVTAHTRDQVWFLDSGCSNHMIGNKEWLFDFDSSFRETVKLGDNSIMSVMGKGNLKLHLEGKISVISDVYYLPNLKNNLLSIGQLQQKNLTIVFSKNTCKIFHEEKGLIISTPMTANRMYVLLAPVMMPQCLVAKHEDIEHIWHCRYGHLNFKGLVTLAKRTMVKGLPILKDSAELCPDCVISKHHRDSIPKTASWRASSKKTWTYPLKDKSSAFEVFRKFKALVEKESDHQIKCLRTDRGGEFTSSQFNDFCSEHGIKRQLTAAYTPQQNGVSERKNRTLMNMVRSMMSRMNVPKRFWPEAVVWATHVINRSPTLSVKNRTPEEAWSEMKPSVAHFKVFGCIAYAHMPDVHRKKLDPKSVKCVHLGVSEELKAYKLYDPVQKKIIISRDVVFDEKQGWKWNETSDKKEIELIDNDAENSVQAEPAEVDPVTTEPAVQSDSDMDTTSEENYDNSEDGVGKRARRPPGWMRDYVTGSELQEEEQLQNLAVFSNNEDPTFFEEVVKLAVWREAMDQEIESIERNRTWELTDLPQGMKKIGVKWVYKTKYNEQGKVEKYKARLVAKGYSQQYGIDFNEVFAPVARWDTIRTILALASSHGWNVYQLDVKSAFLHGDLAEDVYVDQPAGYNKQEGKVYKLKKALYGLKQAPRAWYSKIESYFAQEKFQKCPHEHTLFIKQDDKKNVLIVSLYVDDLIFTGSNEVMFEEFKTSMKSKFSMTDLGKMRYFLGVEVKQFDGGIFICQQKYAKELLLRFKMDQCNKVCSPMVPGNKLIRDENGKLVDATNYRQMTCCLMYLLASRPDLTFSVCLVARYMERPTEIHLAAIKRIMRYLKGTLELGIWYIRNEKLTLVGWSDSDYAGDLDDRKSTSGYVYMLGSSAVSWSSKKQAIVTLSTTEAEFVAAASCACQGIWLRRILAELGQLQECTIIKCDNSSSIKLSKNPVMHGRCKHIDVRYHFLRDLTREGVVELSHCSTMEQIADIMTKPLKLETFCNLRDKLGVYDGHSLE
ncbi:unnamed protein product [Trifolium pratense]|uniref:Uncharacterized protein n=1 Tax=Trifolium pratense TaxID=57577 RepID=A0ACB0KBD4_TRIPR|nr:unnamed protein product [Trifolium pratense]